MSAPLQAGGFPLARRRLKRRPVSQHPLAAALQHGTSRRKVSFPQRGRPAGEAPSLLYSRVYGRAPDATSERGVRRYSAQLGRAGWHRAVLAPSAEGRRADMAAEIHSRPQSSRPVLLSKVEGHQDVVSAALLIPKEDGVITASEDR